MMPNYDPYAPPDLRNHRSLLERKNLNWITRLSAEAVPMVAGLRREAAEFGDDDLEDYLTDFLELSTSINAERAQLVAKTAGVDEERKHAPETQRQDQDVKA